MGCNGWYSVVCPVYVDKHLGESPMDRIAKLRRAHDVLTKRINKLRSGRWSVEESIKAEAAKILGKDGEDIEFEENGWPCEDKRNVIGICVYDGYADPCWDECLFCGEPWERK